MKKILLCFIFSVLFMSFTFSLDLSVGMNGIYERYNQTLSSVSDEYEWLVEGEREKMRRIGAEFFFDAVYLQAALGYSALFYGISGGNGISDSESVIMEESKTYITFSAYAKYPFGKNGITFYPMGGGKCLINLTYKNGDGEDARDSLSIDGVTDLNEYWLKAGLGIDIDINEDMFVRVTGLGGYKFNSRQESNFVDLDLYDYDSCLTLNFEATLGLGYRL